MTVRCVVRCVSDQCVGLRILLAISSMLTSSECALGHARFVPETVMLDVTAVLISTDL